jgi:hypothetical protein
MEPKPSDIVHEAIDTLLLVVDQSARDLRAFHDAVQRARIAPLPPLPRATMVATESIVSQLKKVEEELRHVLVALGVAPSPHRDDG